MPIDAFVIGIVCVLLKAHFLNMITCILLLFDSEIIDMSQIWYEFQTWHEFQIWTCFTRGWHERAKWKPFDYTENDLFFSDYIHFDQTCIPISYNHLRDYTVILTSPTVSCVSLTKAWLVCLLFTRCIPCVYYTGLYGQTSYIWNRCSFWRKFRYLCFI